MNSKMCLVLFALYPLDQVLLSISYQPKHNLDNMNKLIIDLQHINSKQCHFKIKIKKQ